MATKLLARVAAAVGHLVEEITPELLDMPDNWIRDVRRRVTRRVRDLAG